MPPAASSSRTGLRPCRRAGSFLCRRHRDSRTGSRAAGGRCDAGRRFSRDLGRIAGEGSIRDSPAPTGLGRYQSGGPRHADCWPLRSGTKPGVPHHGQAEEDDVPQTTCGNSLRSLHPAASLHRQWGRLSFLIRRLPQGVASDGLDLNRAVPSRTRIRAHQSFSQSAVTASRG